MLQILLAIGAALFVENAFRSKEPNNSSIRGISRDAISEEYLIRYRVRDNESVIKRHITSKINLITDQYDSFKIGKSGVTVRRSSVYQDFSKMYLLCSSSQPDYIERLESYYNNKYYEHLKNMNIRRGSAGRMSDINGLYYLYVVVK